MTRSRTENSEEAKKILDGIQRIARALRLFDRQSRSEHGLSAAQMFVLHTLQQEDGISLNDLASRTSTDQSSASVVVQRLVAADLVSRAPRADDRRHVVLKLTSSGRSLLRRTPAPAQQRLLATVAAMTPRDRKQFAALLESFVDAMGVDEEASPSPVLLAEDLRRRRVRTRA